MPCYTEPHSYCDHKNDDCLEMSKDMKEKLKYYKKTSDQATRLLCSVLGELFEHDPHSKITDPELAEWWEAHKKFDEERK